MGVKSARELLQVFFALGLAPWGPVLLAWVFSAMLPIVLMALIWAACWYTWLYSQVRKT